MWNEFLFLVVVVVVELTKKNSSSTRHEWYQTGPNVIVSVFVRNCKPEDVSIDFETRTVTCPTLPTFFVYAVIFSLFFLWCVLNLFFFLSIIQLIGFSSLFAIFFFFFTMEIYGCFSACVDWECLQMASNVAEQL